MRKKNFKLDWYYQTKKKYKKKFRNNGGFTEKEYFRILKSRKVERPNYIDLKKEISEFGFVKTGKKYGVSDNTIRKWIKFYEKYDN